MYRLLSVAIAISMAVLLASCEEDKGPAEKIGQQVDEAVDKMAEQVESEGPAEKAGERIDQALDQAGEKLREAGQAVGDAMQDAGQKIEQQSGG